jgi:hypothetical protein
MTGKNRIMIYGPKDDGIHVVEFRTSEGDCWHIALAREHIRLQRQLIERLAAEGRDLDDAKDFVAALTSTLGTFERHRLLILDRLASEQAR